MGDAAVAGSNIDVVSLDLQVGDEDFEMIRRSVIIAISEAIYIDRWSEYRKARD